MILTTDAWGYFKPDRVILDEMAVDAYFEEVQREELRSAHEFEAQREYEESFEKQKMSEPYGERNP